MGILQAYSPLPTWIHHGTSQDVCLIFLKRYEDLKSSLFCSYYDSDADLGVLSNKKIVFLGQVLESASVFGPRSFHFLALEIRGLHKRRTYATVASLMIKY